MLCRKVVVACTLRLFRWLCASWSRNCRMLLLQQSNSSGRRVPIGTHCTVCRPSHSSCCPGAWGCCCCCQAAVGSIQQLLLAATATPHTGHVLRHWKPPWPSPATAHSCPSAMPSSPAFVLLGRWMGWRSSATSAATTWPPPCHKVGVGLTQDCYCSAQLCFTLLVLITGFETGHMEDFSRS